LDTRIGCSEEQYKEQVGRSISFLKQDLDFFTEAKARCILDLTRRHLGDPKTLTALDIGCGVGLTDRFLAAGFGKLCGVDIDEPTITGAAEANPSVSYHTYDGKSLPFPDDTFDLVFAVNVMHHIPPGEWDVFVREAYRTVRPGGLVVVFEHNPLNPLTRLAVNRCSFDTDAKLLGKRVLAGLFARNGLALVERRYILFFPFRSGVLTKVEEALGWLPLGAQHYICGRKLNP
jgi:SAM-dependent methyltransferase